MSNNLERERERERERETVISGYTTPPPVYRRYAPPAPKPRSVALPHLEIVPTWDFPICCLDYYTGEPPDVSAFLDFSGGGSLPTPPSGLTVTELDEGVKIWGETVEGLFPDAFALTSSRQVGSSFANYCIFGTRSWAGKCHVQFEEAQQGIEIGRLLQATGPLKFFYEDECYAPSVPEALRKLMAQTEAVEPSAKLYWRKLSQDFTKESWRTIHNCVPPTHILLDRMQVLFKRLCRDGEYELVVSAAAVLAERRFHQGKMTHTVSHGISIPRSFRRLTPEEIEANEAEAELLLRANR